MTSPQPVEIGNLQQLEWTAPSTTGEYVLRYEVATSGGTFADEVTVTVTDLPTGPQTVHPESIPSRAMVGEPTVTVAPPADWVPSLLGGNTVLGQFVLGYAPPTGPTEQTVYPDSIPSRAIVGQPTVTVDPVPLPIVVTPDSIPSRAVVGTPSITLGAAPPDQPITDLTISLFAIDPATGRGIPLPDFEDLDYSRLRNSAGSIRLAYPADGENFDVLRGALTSGRDVEIEIWFSGTAAGADRGYLQEAEGDDVAEGGVWTFGGGRLGLRMDEGIVEPQDPGPLVPDNDDDPDNDKHANERRELIFNRATPGVVMATALQQAQARGVLTDIAWDFTATHDSEGNPWPRHMTTKFSPGATMRQLLDRLATLQLAEWDVVWTGAHRVLRMWVPEGRGQDLSDDAVPVVLRHGQNVLDAPRRWSVREAGTDVWVAGADGLYDDASDPQAVARRGRKIERFISANNLADDEAVLAYAINQLPLITSPTYEITHGIGFAPGQPRPLVSYDIGDWVLSEAGDVRERLRVVQWTLRVDADRNLSGTVTLNDTVNDWLTRLKAQLEAITAGETVVGTSTPPGGSLDDITPPAAPEGLTASSIAYQDPAHTQTLASVTVGWLPVVTNADGSNYPQVQAARHIILRLQDYDPERLEDTGIDSDWTWEDCPPVVETHAPALRAEYTGPSTLPGDIPAMTAWLQSYVDEFSATPTATDDVEGYRVRYAYYGITPVGSTWETADRVYHDATPAGGVRGTSHTFGGVEAGATIRIEVAAYDRSGNQGPWAAIGHDTASDDTPPAQPSPPATSVWFRTMDIAWDGLDLIGAQMPIDFDHVEVWIAQTADFTTLPSTASAAKAFDPLDVNPQHVANLYAAGTWNQPDLTYGVGYYAALRAVDRAGNPSPVSQVVGPRAAEKLFPDDLRDQIINDPRMIAHETIGTAHIREAAIVRALIADLAVDNAKIADLEVGKLRSGTMIAQVTISGKFRTHESDAANRVEFDAAGIRLYRGSQVIGAWNTADASMLITGMFRTGLAGERVEGNPDGTLRFYGEAGSDYAQIANEGAVLRMRSRADANGRRAWVHFDPNGLMARYGTDTITRSSFHTGETYGVLTAAVIGARVDRRFPATDGTVFRMFWTHSSNGEPSGDLGGSVLHYLYVDGKAAITAPGNDVGIRFANSSGNIGDGRLVITDGLGVDAAASHRHLTCRSLTETSSIVGKRDVRAALDLLPVDRTKDIVQRVRAKAWKHRGYDTPRRRVRLNDEKTIELTAMPAAEVPTQFGFIAEELLEVAPQLVHGQGEPGGLRLAPMEIASMAWTAAAEAHDDIDELTERLAAIEAALARLTPNAMEKP